MVSVQYPLVYVVTGASGVGKTCLLDKFRNAHCKITPNSNNVAVFYCVKEDVDIWTNYNIDRTSEVVNILNPKQVSPFFREMAIYASLSKDYEKVMRSVPMEGGRAEFSFYGDSNVTIQPIILLERSLHCAHNIFARMEVEEDTINAGEFQLLQEIYDCLKMRYNVDHTFLLHSSWEVCDKSCTNRNKAIDNDLADGFAKKIYDAYEKYGPQTNSSSTTIIERADSWTVEQYFEVLLRAIKRDVINRRCISSQNQSADDLKIDTATKKRKIDELKIDTPTEKKSLNVDDAEEYDFMASKMVEDNDDVIIDDHNFVANKITDKTTARPPLRGQNFNKKVFNHDYVGGDKDTDETETHENVYLMSKKEDNK